MTLESVLAPAVQKLLDGSGLSNARLIVAVSGGADSVALLHALLLLQDRMDFSLQALHVQHGLRGEASETDERFVRALCKERRVPLTVRKAALSGDMTDSGVETRARDERRRIFAEELGHADALLTAHHADDQAETVLMHLLRGAGMNGLRGMQAVTPFAGKLLLRPFLALRKQALVDALSEAQLPHREDESNRLPCTPRNALRMQIMPALEALYPEATLHIGNAAEAISVDDDLLCEQAQALYQRAHIAEPPFELLCKQPLQAAPEALRRRVMRLWAGDGLTHADTLALCELLFAPQGTTLNLPSDRRALSGAHHLHLMLQSGEPLSPIPPLAPQLVCASQARYAFAGTVVEQAAGGVPTDASAIVLTPEVLALSPTWRLSEPSDRIRPFGAAGAKPLRRYLTDRKLDAPFRKALPVIAVGQDILWIPGLCTAEALRVTSVPEGSLRLALRRAPSLPHQQKE